MLPSSGQRPDYSSSGATIISARIAAEVVGVLCLGSQELFFPLPCAHPCASWIASDPFHFGYQRELDQEAYLSRFGFPSLYVL